MYFPSSYTRVVAIFVVFTITVEFLISAMYIGGVPVAEHDSVFPGDARTIRAGIITLGGTVERTRIVYWFGVSMK